MKCLSTSNLKMIAIISMLIDHIGAVFFPTNYGFRIIGRLAFPIFAFLISEGMVYTKNVDKYLKRIFIFGLISEVPFDWAFSNTWNDFTTWNIMFTLLLGALCIKRIQEYGYGVDTGLIVGIIMVLAQIINVDGGAFGVLTIVMFYCMRKDHKKIFMMLILIYGIGLGWIYKYAVLAMVPIYCYNDKKGKDIKWVAYWFYPVHLAILAAINYWYI